jgi:hypothetical protein
MSFDFADAVSGTLQNSISLAVITAVKQFFSHFMNFINRRHFSPPLKQGKNVVPSLCEALLFSECTVHSPFR